MNFPCGWQRQTTDIDAQNKIQERLIIDSSFVIDRTVLCAAWDEGVTVSGNLWNTNAAAWFRRLTGHNLKIDAFPYLNKRSIIFLKGWIDAAQFKRLTAPFASSKVCYIWREIDLE